MTLSEPPREFGPIMRDDGGHEHRVSEETARSAMGAAGGAFIAMLAWDFGAHEWFTFSTDPHAMPIYLSPLVRMGVRWSGVAVGAAIFRAAWREETARLNPTDDSIALNDRTFVPGRRPGWRQ